MNIEQIEKTVKLIDGRQTIFEFNRLDNVGFSNDQIEYIISVIQNYMKKYAKLEICRVKDFCDDERTFYSDSNGIMYSDMETLANYFYDSKEIALNHIRVSKMPCADSEFVKNIDILTDRMCEIEKKIDAIKLQAMRQ